MIRNTKGKTSLATTEGHNIVVFSDERDKKNIVPFYIGLDVINKLNPVVYTWNPRDIESTKHGVPGIGFTAQNLLEACIDYNDILHAVDTSDPDSLRTNQLTLIPFLINSINELNKLNSEIEEILLNKYNIKVEY